MKIASFAAGTAILLDSRSGTIRLFEPDLAVVRFDDGRIQHFRPNDLRRAYSERRLTFLSPSAPPRLRPRLSAEEAREAERREHYLRALEQHKQPHAAGVREATIGAVAAAIADPSPPAASTLSYWYKLYSRAGRDVAPQVVKKAPRRRRQVPAEVIALMHEAIRSNYLKRSQPTAKSAYVAFRERFEKLGYATRCPSIATFRRLIRSDIDPFEVIAGRKGVSEARAQARVADQKIEVNYPLERVEADTGLFGIGLLNDDGYYVGQVTLYLVIDCYSRAVLGFAIQVGKKKETTAGVIHALTYAVSVKDDANYPMHGLFRTVVVDSGAGYRAEVTRAFFESIADEVITAAARKGWNKPFVEALIGTLRTCFFENMSGYLGKYDPSTIPDETVAKAAKYTVDEFHNLLYEYIVNIYHRTPHSELNGRTPLEVWTEGTNLYPPVVPADIDSLRMLRGLRHERLLSRLHGVNIDYQRYHSRDLADLFDRLARGTRASDAVKVDVLSDPLDAGAVTVVDPTTGELLEVPNIDSRAAGKSFAEANATRHALVGRGAPVLQTGEILRMTRARKNRKGPEVAQLPEGVPLDVDAVLQAEQRPHPRRADASLPIVTLSDTAADDDGTYELD